MRSLLASGIAIVALAGCASRGPRAEPPARSAAGDADIRKLVLDAAAGSGTCERLRDRFIGLPAGQGATVASAGITPIVGRWWIRGCSVARDGDALRLELSGPAWYRVDRVRSGYALHQYVYFDVDATLEGALDIGYDPHARLASVWFTPTQGAGVKLRSLGKLDLHAQSLLSWLALPVADELATGEVVSEGEAKFRRQLDAGVTLTVDLAHGAQVDLVPGQLARGQAPERPYSDGKPWLANERVELFPGGLGVDGPFPPQRTSIDEQLESGAGLDYSLVCSRDLELAFNAVTGGDAPKLPPSAVFQRGRLSLAASVPVVAQCPWYLVTATSAPRALAVLRVRDGQPLTGSARSVVVRLTLVSFDVNRTDPHGDSWDPLDGAPDPEIDLRHDGHRTRLFSASDVYRATPDVAAPDPFELTPGAPISIVAVDQDAVFDDPIGTATLRFANGVRSGVRELPLRLDGKTTGHVRVQVDIVGKW